MSRINFCVVVSSEGCIAGSEVNLGCRRSRDRAPRERRCQPPSPTAAEVMLGLAAVSGLRAATHWCTRGPFEAAPASSIVPGFETCRESEDFIAGGSAWRACE